MCKTVALPTEPSFNLTGRSGRVRTDDPLVPNQMRCHTALHSEKIGGSYGIRTRDLSADNRAHLACYANEPLFLKNGVEQNPVPPLFKIGVRGRSRTDIKRGLQSRASPFGHSY